MDFANNEGFQSISKLKASSRPSAPRSPTPECPPSDHANAAFGGMAKIRFKSRQVRFFVFVIVPKEQAVQYSL